MAADTTRISSSRSPLPFMEVKNLDFKRQRLLRDLCEIYLAVLGDTRRVGGRWGDGIAPRSSNPSVSCSRSGLRRMQRGAWKPEGGDRRTTGEAGWVQANGGCGEAAQSSAERLASAHSGPKLRRLRGGGRLWPAGAAGRTRASQATGGRFDAPVRTPGGRRVRSSAMMSRSTRSAVVFGGPTRGANL